MKFLILGDLHIRATNPRYRTDKYYETLMGKLEWCFELAKEENCEAVLQPGDFFDSPDQSNKVEIDLINLFKEKNIPIYVVMGQHDLRHRNARGTALVKFNAMELVEILDNDPIRYGGDINIYGASWEEEIPEVEDPKALNILVLHKMIVHNKPLWAEQTGYIKARVFLKKYKDFSLVVSGDNHQSFMETSTTEKKLGSVLLNCGSLMRSTTLQRAHTPCVWIYNTKERSFKQYLIPVAPIEDVMDLETADEIKEKNEALEAFMEGLSSEYGVELKFEDNLKGLMTENKTDNRIKKIANSFFEKYYEKH